MIGLLATENSATWFGKKLTRELVEDRFFSTIKWRKNNQASGLSRSVSLGYFILPGFPFGPRRSLGSKKMVGSLALNFLSGILGQLTKLSSCFAGAECFAQKGWGIGGICCL